MADIIQGAAVQSVEDRYGGRVREVETNTTVGVAAASLVPNNPDRLALIVINLGTGTVALGLLGNVTLTRGVLLGANGGSMGLDVIEDLTLVTREWFAIATGASTPVYVLEVMRDVATEGK